MDQVKDYTSDVSEKGNTHYNGVPSEYGKRVLQQTQMQPKYCDPGATDGQMKAAKSNEQAGP